MRNIDEWFSKRVHLRFIVEMNSSLFSITRQGQVKLLILNLFLFLKHSLKHLNPCNLKKILNYTYIIADVLRTECTVEVFAITFH